MVALKVFSGVRHAPANVSWRPCKWFSGEGQCPLENLFSGSPTTAVQPQTGEVAWWPEMAEGEVQLTAVGGLVLLGTNLGNVIYSRATLRSRGGRKPYLC